MAQDYRKIPYAAHITSSTTTTVTSSDCRIYSINIGVPNAGTTWVVKIQNKEGTPKVAYINSDTGVSVGTTNVSFDHGIPMTGGIDIVTSGTAGVMDVFLVYG